MLTRDGRRTLIGNLTRNSASANLTYMDVLMNQHERQLCANRPFDFLQRTRTASTVASQQSYTLPADCDRIVSTTVTIGSIQYTPVESPSRSHWDRLNYTTAITSDVPQWYFVFNGTLSYWPTPSSSTSNAITYTYRKKLIDLTIADYTTGTVDIITNAATGVTGSGTSWTSPMAGRSLSVTASNTAASSGDGRWYEISSVTSSTVLVLSQPYLGTSLTTGAGAAYTLAQVSNLPEPYQMLPVYKAAHIYYMSVQPEAERAEEYNRLYEDLHTQFLADYGSKTANVGIDRTGQPGLNPNLYPNNVG